MTAQPSESGRRVFAATQARAEKGEASAQNELGICYADGKGVPKDAVAAVKWYRQAAEQNLADAQGHHMLAPGVQAVLPRRSLESESEYRKGIAPIRVASGLPAEPPPPSRP